jgi:hypothetical protein
VTQVQILRATRLILAFGDFPAGSPDPATIDVLRVADTEFARLQSPGTKTLRADGTVVVTPPPPPSSASSPLTVALDAVISELTAAPDLATTRTALVKYFTARRAAGG